MENIQDVSEEGRKKEREIQKKHKLYETGENVLHTCDWNEKEMRLKQYLKK